MRYYISDLHFFHESLLTKMDRRGFSSCEEMHEYIVKQWNKKVRDQDDVILLGDVSLARGKQTSDLLRQLHGRLYLIVGNHDTYLQDRRFDTTRFEWIKPYAELHDNKRKVVLSHYPVFCYNGQYRRSGDGSPRTYMLYGHVHDTRDEVLVNEFIRQTRQTRCNELAGGEDVMIPCQMINCFCMFSDYTPLSLEEWIELDEARRQRMWELETGASYCKNTIER